MKIDHKLLLLKVRSFNMVMLFQLLFFSINSFGYSLGDESTPFVPNPKYRPYLEFGGAKYFNQNSNVAGIYDLFLPILQSDDQLFFSDLRIFDRSGSSFEGNAHFGFRKLFSDRKELFGVYAAFDRKRGESSHWFNQLTFGGEYWHDSWFVGANLYRTIGYREALINEGSFETPLASGVDIGVARTITTKGSYERSLSGVDAEVGYTFTDNLTGYIGGYYFTEHNAATTAGPKIRFTYNYSHPTGRFLGILDGISIEAGAQHDKPRGNTAYIGIKFKVGLTNLGNDKGKNSNLFGFERHMTELVRRDPDIVTGKQDYTASERKIDFARLEIQDLPQDILLAEFGLSQDATLKEVEKKYREYAKRYHPDLRGGGDSQEFARYSHLYEVIRDKFKDDKDTLNYQLHQSGGLDNVKLNINSNNSSNFLPATFEWSSLQRMSDSISLAIQQKPIFAPIRWIDKFSSQIFDLFFPIKGVYAIGLGDSLLASQGIGGAFSGLGLEILPSILPRESLSMDRQIGMRLQQYNLISEAIAKNKDLVSQPSLGAELQDQDLSCNFTVFGGLSGFSGIIGYSSRGGTENIGDRVNIELCERSNKGCNIDYRDVPLYAKSDVSLLSSQTDSQVGYEVVLPVFDEVVVPQSKKVLFSSNLEVSSSDSKILFSRDSKMSSRDLIAGSLSQGQIYLKDTLQLTSFSGGYSQDINPDYEYEAQDMDTLLPLRAKEAGLNLKNTVILRAMEDKELENQLLIENYHHLEKFKYDQNKIDVSHARDLLIPINLSGTHHWIGVIVRINETNNPYAAYYLDSLSDSSLLSQSEVALFFHHKRIKLKKAKELIQCDNTSCGPVAIENLIRVTTILRRREDLDVTLDTADNSSLMLNEEGTKKIRENHINLAENYVPFLRLKYRQQHNLRTFEYLTESGKKARIEIPMNNLFQKLETDKEFNQNLILRLAHGLLFLSSQFNLVDMYGGGGEKETNKDQKKEDDKLIEEFNALISNIHDLVSDNTKFSKVNKILIKAFTDIIKEINGINIEEKIKEEEKHSVEQKPDQEKDIVQGVNIGKKFSMEQESNSEYVEMNCSIISLYYNKIPKNIDGLAISDKRLFQIDNKCKDSGGINMDGLLLLDDGFVLKKEDLMLVTQDVLEYLIIPLYKFLNIDKNNLTLKTEDCIKVLTYTSFVINQLMEKPGVDSKSAAVKILFDDIFEKGELERYRKKYFEEKVDIFIKFMKEEDDENPIEYNSKDYPYLQRIIRLKNRSVEILREKSNWESVENGKVKYENGYRSIEKFHDKDFVVYNMENIEHSSGKEKLSDVAKYEYKLLMIVSGFSAIVDNGMLFNNVNGVVYIPYKLSESYGINEYDNYTFIIGEKQIKFSDLPNRKKEFITNIVPYRQSTDYMFIENPYVITGKTVNESQMDLDFYISKENGINVYKSFTGFAKDTSPTIVIEIEFNDIYDPVFARFLRLLTAIYVREKGKFDFSAYDKSFSGFIFKRMCGDLKKYNWGEPNNEAIYNSDDHKQNIKNFGEYIKTIVKGGVEYINSNKSRLYELLIEHGGENAKINRFYDGVLNGIGGNVIDVSVDQLNLIKNNYFAKELQINEVHKYLTEKIRRYLEYFLRMYNADERQIESFVSGVDIAKERYLFDIIKRTIKSALIYENINICFDVIKEARYEYFVSEFKSKLSKEKLSEFKDSFYNQVKKFIKEDEEISKFCDAIIEKAISGKAISEKDVSVKDMAVVFKTWLEENIEKFLPPKNMSNRKISDKFKNDIKMVLKDMADVIVSNIKGMMEGMIEKEKKYYKNLLIMCGSNIKRQYLFYDSSARAVSWPNSHSGVDYVDDKDLIDDAIKILKKNLWYTDDDINILLNKYLGDSEVNLMTAIGLDQRDGKTLKENLLDLEILSSQANSIVVPINIGNSHWVGLYIHHDSETDRTRPSIGYFDPFGGQIPDLLVGVLQTIYPNTRTEGYLVSPIKLQNDGYNCGPWVVEIFRYLVKEGNLPPEDFDININTARQEHYFNLQRFRDGT